MDWRIESRPPGIDKILPSMPTDIVMDHRDSVRRVILDTKFNSILTKGWHRDESLRSGYVYQIYAYLRSQEGNGYRIMHPDSFCTHRLMKRWSMRLQ